MGLKEQILAAKGRKVSTLSVPQWGFDVCIRTWTPSELDEWQSWLKDAEPSMKVLARMAVMSLCDESGNTLFTIDDMAALCEKDMDALQLICDESLKLNRLQREPFRESNKQSATAF